MLGPRRPMSPDELFFGTDAREVSGGVPSGSPKKSSGLVAREALGSPGGPSAFSAPPRPSMRKVVLSRTDVAGLALPHRLVVPAYHPSIRTLNSSAVAPGACWGPFAGPRAWCCQLCDALLVARRGSQSPETRYGGRISSMDHRRIRLCYRSLRCTREQAAQAYAARRLS